MPGGKERKIFSLKIVNQLMGEHGSFSRFFAVRVRVRVRVSV